MLRVPELPWQTPPLSERLHENDCTERYATH